MPPPRANRRQLWPHCMTPEVGCGGGWNEVWLELEIFRRFRWTLMELHGTTWSSTLDLGREIKHVGRGCPLLEVHLTFRSQYRVPSHANHYQASTSPLWSHSCPSSLGCCFKWPLQYYSISQSHVFPTNHETLPEIPHMISLDGLALHLLKQSLTGSQGKPRAFAGHYP